jgi:copper/silver efflux system protein
VRGNEPGLIARTIGASLANPGVVALSAALLTFAGLWALLRTPVDALPDLGDVQVIVRTPFPGHAPNLVEDQVTFPLSTAMLGVARAAKVRGYSMFGDSFVYVLFEDGTDPYWARARVNERLAQASAQLPEKARPILAPDASGVGWIYEYALIDRTGQHDLAQLRALQDWVIKFELQALPGVAEVAAIGGMVKEYQVVADPDRLRVAGVTLGQLRAAIENGNGASGGSIVELAEAEYMVRASAYVQSVEDLQRIPVRVSAGAVPLTVRDLAEVRVGPELRRGIADLDGEGEVVGGVVIMRDGENARQTLAGVKQRIAELSQDLPAGIEIVATYDRSSLIDRAIHHLTGKLTQEFVVVLLVCVAFLLHFRSAVVVLVALPLGMLGAFLLMRAQGITANIMSLGGIAVALGVMVDAAIVMVENLHRRLERSLAGAGERGAIVLQACTEVGPILFLSLLIVALSFVPVLAFEGQEGRLFAPLAYTKTYAMLAAALISITLVPVLAAWLVTGPVRAEAENPLNRLLAGLYAPVLALSLRRPRAVVIGALALILVSLWPASRLGTEFMPQMDEGDLLYMPATQPGLAADAARALLQQTDRALREVPEVVRVFGKAGRADTATDPAPLEMLETVIALKPQREWRSGLTAQALQAQLAAQVDLPGVANTWTAPIRARIDMLATGIRTPLGVKVVGPDIHVAQQIAVQLEGVLRGIPGALSVYAERPGLGRYITIDIDRAAAARFGLNISDLDEVVSSAIGGTRIGEAVRGRERYPISLRYPQSWRDSVARLEALPIVTPTGAQIALQDVTQVKIADGPATIRSENARPAAWVTVDPGERDIGAFVHEARARVAATHIVPRGYRLVWSGQYEYLQRALERLKLIVPLVVGVIVLLLFLGFRSWSDVALILGSLPVALIGSVWLLWALDYDVSVAVVVGLIALAGVAAETGIVMLLYLNSAWRQRQSAGRALTVNDLEEAITEGALRRLRPKMMTVLTIMLGLLPLLIGQGAGAEILRRIAAPMVGGMVSATVLTLFVVPALFLLLRRRGLRASE